MTDIELRRPDVSVVVAPSSTPYAADAVGAGVRAAVDDLQPFLGEPIEVVDALDHALGHVVVVIDRDMVIDQQALAALVIAVADAEQPTLAVPMTTIEAPCAAVHQALLPALADAFGAAADLTGAVAALVNAGVPWVAVREATARPAPQQAGPRVIPPAPRQVIPPAWTPETMGRHLDVAHPEAVTVGTQTYFQPGTVVKTYWPTERVQIGAYCCIAAEVHLVHGGGPLRTPEGKVVPTRLMHSHHPACATSFPIDRLLPDDAKPFDQGPFDGSLTSKPLVIGSDVWIGYRATVYGPITVGHGAIIGVGSVVVGDVPPYAVVAGNPAKVVRMRFSPTVVERLLAVQWWDWPPEVVRQRWEWFTKPIAEFLALAEST